MYRLLPSVECLPDLSSSLSFHRCTLRAPNSHIAGSVEKRGCISSNTGKTFRPLTRSRTQEGKHTTFRCLNRTYYKCEATEVSRGTWGAMLTYMTDTLSWSSWWVCPVSKRRAGRNCFHDGDEFIRGYFWIFPRTKGRDRRLSGVLFTRCHGQRHVNPTR